MQGLEFNSRSEDSLESPVQQCSSLHHHCCPCSRVISLNVCPLVKGSRLIRNVVCTHSKMVDHWNRLLQHQYDRGFEVCLYYLICMRFFVKSDWRNLFYRCGFLLQSFSVRGLSCRAQCTQIKRAWKGGQQLTLASLAGQSNHAYNVNKEPHAQWILIKVFPIEI